MAEGAHTPRLLSAATSIVTLLASVASLAISLYTLVFLIKPNLKPPEKLGVTITRIALTHSVPLHAQIEESFPPRQGIPPVQSIPLFRKVLGVRVWAEIDVQGFQTRSYGALLQLIDVTDKTSNRKRSIEAASLCPDFTPSASTDKVVLRCWIQAPSKAGRFVVRVAVYEVEKTKPAAEGLRFRIAGTEAYSRLSG
jgi:hypothetical protein